MPASPLERSPNSLETVHEAVFFPSKPLNHLGPSNAQGQKGRQKAVVGRCLCHVHHRGPEGLCRALQNQGGPRVTLRERPAGLGAAPAVRHSRRREYRGDRAQRGGGGPARGAPAARGPQAAAPRTRLGRRAPGTALPAAPLPLLSGPSAELLGPNFPITSASVKPPLPEEMHPRQASRRSTRRLMALLSRCTLPQPRQ